MTFIFFGTSIRSPSSKRTSPLVPFRVSASASRMTTRPLASTFLSWAINPRRAPTTSPLALRQGVGAPEPDFPGQRHRDLHHPVRDLADDEQIVFLQRDVGIRFPGVGALWRNRGGPGPPRLPSRGGPRLR